MTQLRLPSVKTLMRVFGFEDLAKQARAVLEMSRAQLLEHPVGAALEKACFHPPKTSRVRMAILDSLDPGLFGVEYVQIKNTYVGYLNTGETYADTIIYYNGRYRVSSLGDFIERNERRIPK